MSIFDLSQGSSKPPNLDGVRRDSGEGSEPHLPNWMTQRDDRKVFPRTSGRGALTVGATCYLAILFRLSRPFA